MQLRRKRGNRVRVRVTDMKLTTVTELAERLGVTRREIQRRALLLQIEKVELPGFAKQVYQFDKDQVKLIESFSARKPKPNGEMSRSGIWRRKQKGK
jgi:uncharacterized small protein (DUF1192 family)